MVIFSTIETVRAKLPFLCSDSHAHLCLAVTQRLGWPYLDSSSCRRMRAGRPEETLPTVRTMDVTRETSILLLKAA